MVAGRCRLRLAWAWALALGMGLSTAGAQSVDVQGHRGARGLVPENTLAGFEHAVRLGVTTLELDLGLTRDGVLVVHHDRRLQPDHTRDASGRWLQPPTPTLRALSLAELQAHDVGRARPGSATARTFPEQQPRDGERVPTLQALFDRVQALGAGQVHFNLEIKVSPLAPDETAPPEAMADALLALLRQRGLLARATVQSFDWRVLAHLRRTEPSLRLSALSMAALGGTVPDDGAWTAGLRLAEHGGSVPRMVKALGAQVWSPRFDTLSPTIVQEAHALGLKVVPWTVNAPADIERMLELGVDGIISDHPERVLAALSRRGLRAAPLP